MKAKLIVFLIFPFCFILSARADSATWKLTPGSSVWNTPANWTPVTVPNNPHDIATFGVSNVTAISLSADTSVDGAVFNPGASAFSITAPAGRTLIFSGQGVTNNSGFVQNFSTETNGDKAGMIVFVNEATAGDSSVFTAGSDLVHGEDSFIKFFGNSSAGNATFVIEGGGSLAEDFYGSTLVFDESSTAGNATIITKAGAGETDFFGSSTAGSASITLEGPSTTTFYGGFSGFYGTSSAGNSTITVAGSPGGPGNADFGGALTFHEGSNVGSALITIDGATGDSGAGGVVTFRGGRVSLANATLIANGTNFQDATGGEIHFMGAKDNGNATIIINGGQTAGGQCTFGVNNTKGRARIKIFGNGLMIVVDTVQVGSIEGDGAIAGLALLQIGSNNRSTTFSGLIQDFSSPAAIEKIGTGTLTLSGANTYTGRTTVSSGTLLVSNVDGSGAGTGKVSVNAGTLGGSGIIAGAVTVGTNTGVQAFLAPSEGATTPATLTIQSALTLNDDSTYIYALDTGTVQADQVITDGVTIDNGAKFSFHPSGNNALTIGQVFTVINNTAATAITGMFNNLSEGEILTVNGSNLQASYTGGDGNDLTLTVVP